MSRALGFLNANSLNPPSASPRSLAIPYKFEIDGIMVKMTVSCPGTLLDPLLQRHSGDRMERPSARGWNTVDWSRTEADRQDTERLSQLR